MRLEQQHGPMFGVKHPMSLPPPQQQQPHPQQQPPLPFQQLPQYFTMSTDGSFPMTLPYPYAVPTAAYQRFAPPATPYFTFAPPPPSNVFPIMGNGGVAIAPYVAAPPMAYPQHHQPASGQLSPSTPSLANSLRGDGADDVDGRQQQADIIHRNLYVTGLAQSIDDREMRDIFAPFGPVESVKIMLNLDTGTSRGFGFVLYEDPSGAERAIAALHGTSLHGRLLSVKLVDPTIFKAVLPGQPTRKVFVRNVPSDVSPAQFKQILPVELQYCDVALSPSATAGPGTGQIAHLVFNTVDDARRAAGLLHRTKPFAHSQTPLLTKVVDSLVRHRQQVKADRAARGSEAPSFLELPAG